MKHGLFGESHSGQPTSGGGSRFFFVWLRGLAGPGRIAVVVVLCTAVGLSLSFCVDGVTGDSSPFPERLTDSFFLVFFFIPSDTLGGGGGGGGDRKQGRAAAAEAEDFRQLFGFRVSSSFLWYCRPKKGT